MGAKIAVGVIFLVAAAAFIFTGVAFAGYAIAQALAPSLGVAGGAAIAALVLLLPPFCAVIAVLFLQAAAERRRREERREGTEEAIISLLSFLAGDRPWIAVAGAAIVGAASYFLRGKRKK